MQRIIKKYPYVSDGMRCRDLSEALESLYHKLNKREFVSPDPLQFLYNYRDIADREIAGLVASAFAYGRVTQIIAAVEKVFSRVGPSPYEFLKKNSEEKTGKMFRDIRYRFTDGEEIGRLFVSIRRILADYGSLQECFLSCLSSSHETVLPALVKFAEKLSPSGNTLVPSPKNGSAMKRLNLFLRWMCRKDEVDPGGWKGVPPSKLIIPLDTHMHSIAMRMGFTRRTVADMDTALEITEVFRKIRPDDPVRYDFSLTRLGIRKDMDRKSIFKMLGINNERQ